MKISDSGREVLVEITQRLKVYIAKLPKILSEEDKEVLIQSIINFRHNIEKEVQMNI